MLEICRWTTSLKRKGNNILTPGFHIGAFNLKPSSIHYTMQY